MVRPFSVQGLHSGQQLASGRVGQDFCRPLADRSALMRETTYDDSLPAEPPLWTPDQFADDRYVAFRDVVSAKLREIVGGAYRLCRHVSGCQ
jgi:hypothetical protein